MLLTAPSLAILALSFALVLIPILVYRTSDIPDAYPEDFEYMRANLRDALDETAMRSTIPKLVRSRQLLCYTTTYCKVHIHH